jgi:hypothetical protein
MALSAAHRLHVVVRPVMTVKQLSAVKRWLAARRRDHPMEYHAWDAVLTLWLIGWMGMPAEFVLGQLYGLAACALLLFTPVAYVSLRRHLHACGRVRCDWLSEASPARRRP